MKQIVYSIIGICLFMFFASTNSVNASKVEYVNYQVKKGDTLWGISQKNKIDIIEIKNINGLQDDMIHIGQSLKIPSPTEGEGQKRHVVTQGDTLWTLAHKYETTVQKIQSENSLQSNMLQIGQILVISPIDPNIDTHIDTHEGTIKDTNIDSTIDSNIDTENTDKDTHFIGLELRNQLHSFFQNEFLFSQLPLFYSRVLSQFDLPIVLEKETIADRTKQVENTTVQVENNTLQAKDSTVKVKNNTSPVKKSTSEVKDNRPSSQTQPKSPKPTPKAKVKYSPEDLKWLETIIEAEAEDQPYLGKVAVGSVIINRIKSGQFPDTIQEVIFQKTKKVYQFSPVGDGRIYRVTPSNESKKAAKAALYGEDPTNGALYFYNPKIAKSKWIRTREVAVVIGEHNFAY